jgi:hypothetical protein
MESISTYLKDHSPKSPAHNAEALRENPGMEGGAVCGQPGRIEGTRESLFSPILVCGDHQVKMGFLGALEQNAVLPFFPFQIGRSDYLVAGPTQKFRTPTGMFWSSSMRNLAGLFSVG